MPKQEKYLSERANDVLIEVIKTYDSSYAREVFRGISEEARSELASALQIGSKYDESDVPEPTTPEYEDLVWEEMSDCAVEDVRQSPRLQSFFVVTVTKAGRTEDVYISPDWPSAEMFARNRLAQTLGS